MSENLKNFENLKEKRSKFSLVLNPLTSPKLARCFRPHSYKLESSAFALLFTEISVVWFTEISVKSSAKADDSSYRFG